MFATGGCLIPLMTSLIGSSISTSSDLSPTSTPTSSPFSEQSHTASIAGSVGGVAGAILAALLIWLLFYCRKRKKQKQIQAGRHKDNLPIREWDADGSGNVVKEGNSESRLRLHT